MKPLLILISGKKGVGKDTFASFFRNFSKIALADSLKANLLVILNEFLFLKPQISLHDMYYNKEMLIDIPFANGERRTLRIWMQQYGQLMKKLFGEHYWSDIVVRVINEELPTKNVIITDVRFPNELTRIKEKLGNSYVITAIRIKRDTGFIDSDPSETSLDSYSDDTFDFLVDNNRSLDDLMEEFRSIYNNILSVAK